MSAPSYFWRGVSFQGFGWVEACEAGLEAVLEVGLEAVEAGLEAVLEVGLEAVEAGLEAVLEVGLEAVEVGLEAVEVGLEDGGKNSAKAQAGRKSSKRRKMMIKVLPFLLL